MKRFLLCLSLGLMLGSVTVFALDRIEGPKNCSQCGMDRTMFAYSRTMVVYADGGKVGTCSLHCATVELKKNAGKPVKSLQVADYRTQALLDAKKATWVIGGKQGGVMTAVPKWAFAKKSDAEAFVKENGGKLAGFDEVMALAKSE